MATYYVDKTTGDDSDTGLTEALAWETISKVNGATFAAGDEILFKRGEIWRETLTVPLSGTAAAPVVFGAYGTGARPRITGCDAPTTWTISAHANLFLKDTGAAVTTVTQLFETGVPLTAVAWDTDLATTYLAMSAGTYTLGEGVSANTLFVWATDSADPDTHHMEYTKRNYAIAGNAKEHITFNDLHVYGAKTSGVYHDAASAQTYFGLRFNRCLFTLNYGASIDLKSSGSGDADIYVTDCTFKDYGTAGSAIKCNVRLGSARVDNCRFDGVDHGMHFKAAQREILVRNCVCLDSNDDFIFLEDCVGGGMVHHNIVIRCGDDGIDVDASPNVRVFNNTFAYGQDTALVVKTGSTGFICRNNVFAENNQTTGAGNDHDVHVTPTDGIFDYNLYYNSTALKMYYPSSTYSTLATWQAATGQDANSVVSDPLFELSSADDLVLRSSSPANNAGTDLSFTEDWQGYPVAKGHVSMGAIQKKGNVY